MISLLMSLMFPELLRCRGCAILLTLSAVVLGNISTGEFQPRFWKILKMDQCKVTR